MTYLVSNWYVSNAVMTLATVLATIECFYEGTRWYGVPADVAGRDVQII